MSPITVNQPASEDLFSLRRMLARRRVSAACVGLTAAGYIALLRRVPAEMEVWVDVRDLNTLVEAGDAQRGG